MTYGVIRPAADIGVEVCAWPLITQETVNLFWAAVVMLAYAVAVTY